MVANLSARTPLFIIKENRLPAGKQKAATDNKKIMTA
jgi:hypothetical protein